MRLEPMINVMDVPASSAFYQTVFGCNSGHGGDNYEKLMLDGEQFLQLHRLEAPEHPEMWRENNSVGNGVVFWFQTANFDALVASVKTLNAPIVAGPQMNTYKKCQEFWFKDPDGYLIAVCEV